MGKRVIDGFVLEEAAVVCPECKSPFATEFLVETRKLNSSDLIEADLHRVFNDPKLRAAMLSCCPTCKYCSWTCSFKSCRLNPELVKEEANIEPGKKFALAVKWAREKKLHSLDIAFIAINGLWCAREAGEPDNKWLELSIFEHEKGIATFHGRPQENGMTHLLMAELYRQHRDFDKALEFYRLAEEDDSIVKDVIEHQKLICSRKISSVTALPLKIARMLFDVEDVSASSAEALDFRPSGKDAGKPASAAEPGRKSENTESESSAAAGQYQASKAEAEMVKEEAAGQETESGTAPLLAAISSLFSGSNHSLISASAEDRISVDSVSTSTGTSALSSSECAVPVASMKASTQGINAAEAQKSENPIEKRNASEAPQTVALGSIAAKKNNSTVRSKAGNNTLPSMAVIHDREEIEKRTQPGVKSRQAARGARLSAATVAAGSAQEQPLRQYAVKLQPAADSDTGSRSGLSKTASASTVSISVTAVAAASAQPVKDSSSKSGEKENSAAPAKTRNKKARAQEREHHFARRAVYVDVARNKNGWINDYGNDSFSEKEGQSVVAENCEPGLQAFDNKAAAGSNEAAVQEASAPLPGLNLQETYKKDYSDAINRVENYLSLSRRIQSKSWMKL